MKLRVGRNLIAAVALILVAASFSRAEDTASASSPNVLLIITDDQGYGDLSIHGNPHLRTPHLDRLGRESVRFDRFFVSSFCAPTRAALLTGRWPLRTGCHGVTRNAEAMRPSEVTLAEALAGRGYRSACIGKWHNGEQFPFTPTGQGFHEAFGFNAGHVNLYFDPVLLRGSTPEPTKGYITDVLTDEAMRFISANRNQPFFCYLSHPAPHSPYQVPDRYFDRFKAKGFDDTVAAFFGMCENLDDNVGRLLAHLEAEGVAENTIVLFLTDNGGTAGVRVYNAGMRGGKTSVHEGGSRVPLFVRWPAAKWKPAVVDRIVAHVDLFPTLLDLCESPTPDTATLDGLSLRPLLEAGNQTAWPERTLFIHNPIDETNRYPGAVRTERYRLVREIEGPSGGSRAKANDASATPWQLYDMQADPGQRKNVANDHPEIVTELSARYESWFADISRAGLERFPLPIGHPEQNPVDLHAPQAFFTEPLRYAVGSGAANDWLTSWTDPQARLWFEVDVATAGQYEVEVAFACSAADAGSRVILSAGRTALEVEVPAAPAREIPLPHRDGKSPYRNREWSSLRLGSIPLEEGRTRITLGAVSKPGSQVMDFKHLRLTRRPMPTLVAD